MIEMQRIALVTGGSRGLGRSTAESLAKKGVDVVITYMTRADEAQKVVADLRAQGRRAVALQLDTSRVGLFGTFADQLGHVLHHTWGRETFDYLVNNAGTGFHKSILDTTEADFDALVSENLDIVFWSVFTGGLTSRPIVTWRLTSR